MKSIQPIEATHNFKPPKNWEPEADGECGDLWIRLGSHGARDIPTFTSAWRPTVDELAALNAGGEIEITLVGSQPPMSVDVVASRASVRPHITINDEAIGLGFDEHGPVTP